MGKLIINKDQNTNYSLADVTIPSGSLDITSNGTYNVKEKESVNVNVTVEGVTTLKKAFDVSKTITSFFANDNYNKNITTLDGIVSYNDTSNVVFASYFCNGAINLRYVPPLNTSNMLNMSCMFQNCYSLEALDFSHFINNVIINSLAIHCYSLKKLIVRNIDIIPVYAGTLKECYHFSGTVNATYNPQGLKDGFLYVPDDKVEEMKVATGWTEFATQIKGLSELPEGDN